MVHSFPNVRIGLMVGVGGGAPSPKHDIRLGDIVVGSRSGEKGGVFQYDYGKAIQEQDFLTTGHLNQAPQSMLTAVSALEARYEKRGHQLNEYVGLALGNIKRRKKYSRPNSTSDRLYLSTYTHRPNSSEGCSEVCGNDPGHLVTRPERDEDEDDPAVHYGLIASANTLMKDATVRDKLAMDKDVLCFEMEAAGLMSHFPCLVIRGICDYSDSHKNEEWQGYAAMTAAAYAKDLLCHILPRKIESEKRIGDILSGLREVAQKQLDVQKAQLQAQENFANERMSDKEAECHQAFRLTADGSDSTYEWYKSRVEERVDDPGCGKSVLAKYLVDKYLPRSASICYFFFKGNDQNTVRQALCALLHQLFTQKQSLIKHAMKEYRRDGNGLINSTESLWRVLRNAFTDPEAGTVIIVLDALDESDEHEFAHLVTEIERQFCRGQTGYGKLKYLLTCRPYDQIVSRFWLLLKDFPNIRIPGEEESETISQEVNLVIAHRINQLSEQKCLSTQIKSHLEKRLKEVIHRTYLWVYLVFDYLENEDFKKTRDGVDESTIAKLPGTVNQAYEQILNKSKDRPMVQKALSIILAASRPLTLSEMNIAVNIEHTSKAIDLEDEKDFQARLRSWCGLFVSIHRGKVYFLHQTGRDFLLADMVSPTAAPSGPLWQQSIAIQQAHNVLAEVCVTYLNFFDCDVGLRGNANGGIRQSGDSHAFLDYAAKAWGDHFRLAGVKDGHSILPIVLSICSPASKCYAAWFRVYWQSTGSSGTDNFTDLMVASYFGHQAAVKLLLERGADVGAKDSVYNRTPLLWAAKNGHEAVVKLLLERGADVSAKEDSVSNRTPLSWAAKNGHKAVVKLLLEYGANVKSEDLDGWKPLPWAAGNGHEPVVKLLLENGANVEAENPEGWKPLSLAARNGHKTVVKLLLENLANVEAETPEHWTPLLLATENGHEAVVKLLLENGANVEAEDSNGWKPLRWAAVNGHVAVVKLLLENGANVEAEDPEGWKPLSLAAERGHGAVVGLLLENGANVEAEGPEGWQPLAWAARNGHEAVVNLLLENGAEDSDGWKPLRWAAVNGHEAVVKLLLENGANVQAEDPEGWNPLLLAAVNGHEAVVKLLLENGANVEAEDSWYHHTPLLLAAVKGHEAVVKLLLKNDAIVEAEDPEGWNPLSLAAVKGYEAVVKLLLENDANIEAEGPEGWQPLSWAARYGHEAVVKLLLENGANVKSEGPNGWKPLRWAAVNGHEAVVELLLNNDVNVEAEDPEGWNPLLLAAVNGHETVVKLLLENGVNVEAEDPEGWNPLSLAAVKGYEAVVKLLLKNNANVEAEGPEGWNPLSLAAMNGHEAVVKLLLENGANVEAEDPEAWNPLSLAAVKGYEAVVKLLLNNGANVEAEDPEGWTPLSLAAVKGYEAVVKLLLKNNANVEAEGPEGWNPLSLAARNGHEAVVKLLLNNDANVEAEGPGGWNLLSLAARNGHEAVVKLLHEPVV
ncbi:hypothetical protein O9K51_09452 [Purpureocillium lavendulum]|uniref:Nucleoside phosphorylase domain-containing protein n=1 Tax=Purpureocillium lavendulum TaxID=1247861 RepID=A0AB34FI79_9HYPO|nr:hypothetical protein O9K51_09452 [Purpureocillium lavendulum]